jgi:hypothetical protein
VNVSTPRINADFQKLDDENRLCLTCAGTQRDLAKHGIELREGLTLTFYTDDEDDAGHRDELRVEGVVHFDAAEACWVAEVDWSALRHASDELPANGSSSAAPGVQEAHL